VIYHKGVGTVRFKVFLCCDLWDVCFIPRSVFQSPVFSAKTIYLHVVIAVTKCLLIL